MAHSAEGKTFPSLKEWPYLSFSPGGSWRGREIQYDTVAAHVGSESRSGPIRKKECLSNSEVECVKRMYPRWWGPWPAVTAPLQLPCVSFFQRLWVSCYCPGWAWRGHSHVPKLQSLRVTNCTAFPRPPVVDTLCVPCETHRLCCDLLHPLSEAAKLLTQASQYLYLKGYF